MRTARTIMWLTWRQLFARRRIWMAIAFAVVPFLLTFFYRFTSEDREGDRIAFMLILNREIILSALLPLVAVMFGTTAFGGEVDDGTLIYLLVKPVSRWQVVVLKFLVAVAATMAVGVVAIVLPWLSLRNAELPGRFVVAFLAAAAVSSVLYSAIFTYLGLLSRRALIFGLLYIIFFENVLSRNFAGVQSLSARELSVAVAQWASKGVVTWPTPPVEMSTVWTVGAVIVVVALGVAMRKFARYELAERL